MDAVDVRELLDDRPALEDALREVRSVDETAESWSFDDVPVDSGAFGELVGAGVVESAGDAYRLADPEAVTRALAADSTAELEAAAGGRSLATGVDLSAPTVDRTAAAVLAGLLVLTAAFRASTYRSVFRDRVVYPANDPYAYVYFVETGLRGGWALSVLPAGQGNEEPLTLAVLLWAAEIAGGLGSHGPVLAWLPVLAAVATAGVLYLFAREVSDDRRVALAAVFVLAVLPVHVLRTSLGFVDHHAFDYFWLTLTAWGTVATFDLQALRADWQTVRAVGLLAIGVAGGILAWWAAALLLFSIAIAVVVAGAVAIRDDEPFHAPGLATATGVGIGTMGIIFVHVAWGWHDVAVVGAPAVLAVGIAGVTGATYAWRDLELPPWTFPVVGVGGVAVTAGGIVLYAPEAHQLARSQIFRLFGDEEIVEVQSIFGAETMGWLFSFGLLLFVIVPAMGWGVYRGHGGDRRWLVASTFAWFLLFLAGFQGRYAGEFAPFAALFAGLALVGLAERVDAARPPVPFGGEDRPLSLPERDAAARLAVVVLLVCGLSAVLAPIGAGNVTIPDEQYGTAVFIDAHAIEAGHEYPDSYVFSPWSWSRMYNYHVSGESRGYGHADTHYRPFSVSEDPEAAHERHIAGGMADDAYLVTEPVPGDPDLPPATMQSRLHDRYGSRGGGVAGLAHYRALYASPSGDYKAFRVVEGATIRGEADAGATVTLETAVDIEGDEFTYERRVTADQDGEYAVTVPYPGEYDLEGATAESVTVEETAVTDGTEVQAG